jgi:peptidoglycan/LPS O-acetylase OafA/YrhL
LGLRGVHRADIQGMVTVRLLVIGSFALRSRASAVLSVMVISVPGGIRASHQLENSSTRNVAYWLRMRSLGLRAGLAAHLQIRNRTELHHVPL